MQVFDFFLKPSDPFRFRQNAKGKVSVLRKLNPSKVVRKPEKIIHVYSWLIAATDAEEMIGQHLLSMVEALLKNFPDHNIFIARRDSHDQVEFGIFGCSGFSTQRNHQMEEYIQRLLQLKVFW